MICRQECENLRLMLVIRRTVSCKMWRREVLTSYTENGGNRYLQIFKKFLSEHIK